MMSFLALVFFIGSIIATVTGRPDYMALLFLIGGFLATVCWKLDKIFEQLKKNNKD
jgi:hypothetical protein